MRVAFICPEVSPFSKTGGLADVAGALPPMLKTLKNDVIVITPKYKCCKNIKNPSFLPSKTPVYFINNKKFFYTDNLYGTAQGDYENNLERFSFFCKEAMILIKKVFDKPPSIIHVNDWQTALIPVYLKTLYSKDSYFKNVKSVMTIHNLAYQGIFPYQKINELGLDAYKNFWGSFEFYGKINLLKAGIIFSDFITTVSQAYAQEIQTVEYGFGLEGIMQKKQSILAGIINGLDYNLWNPQTDKSIYFNYSSADITNKAKNKTMLQKELGLDVNKKTPLIGIVTRLADQKGLDILEQIIEPVISKAQFILLGTGDPRYEKIFYEFSTRHPKKVSANIKFDSALANKIYAASDIFLMPSKYEPCGLGQLIALRYGTIPVVRRTGGLADTIRDMRFDKEKGNGFLFDEYNANEFLKVVNDAVDIYLTKTAFWRKKIKFVMNIDYSWKHSAKIYNNLYKKISK